MRDRMARNVLLVIGSDVRHLRFEQSFYASYLVSSRATLAVGANVLSSMINRWFSLDSVPPA